MQTFQNHIYTVPIYTCTYLLEFSLGCEVLADIHSRGSYSRCRLQMRPGRRRGSRVHLSGLIVLALVLKCQDKPLLVFGKTGTNLYRALENFLLFRENSMITNTNALSYLNYFALTDFALRNIIVSLST